VIALMLAGVLAAPAAIPAGAPAVASAAAESAAAAMKSTPAAVAAESTAAATEPTSAAGPAPAPAPAGEARRVRIPGTRLYLGGLPAEVTSAGSFAAAPGDRRQGTCRYFGLDATATLSFVQGRLTRASFELDSLSPHSVDYIEDQLRLAGYRRGCTTLEATW
jgi:hypothetical protein